MPYIKLRIKNGLDGRLDYVAAWAVVWGVSIEEAIERSADFHSSKAVSAYRHFKEAEPNLQKKTIFVDGKKVKLKISTQALRTLKKKGLLTTAK